MSEEAFDWTRIQVLMKIEPYRVEFHCFEFPLSPEEVDVVATASLDEWRQARRMLEAERTVIAEEFDTLAGLLDVIGRNPGRVSVAVKLSDSAGATAVMDAAPSAGAGDVVARDAERWGLSVEDYRAAVLALDALGWIAA